MNTILWITMSIGAVLLIIGFYVSFKEWQAEKQYRDYLENDEISFKE